MAETKFGFDQIDIPAPLWYRKLTNAIVLCFLPIYVGFINIIDMSDYKRSILAQVGIGIPFLLKGIAMIIGNGQQYVPSNKTIENMRMIIFILCLGGLAFASCNPSKKAHQYFNQNPNDFAVDCAIAFPIEEIVDSSGWLESKKIIDSIAREIDNTKMASQELSKRQLAEIDRLRNSPAPNCDSVTEAVYQYAATQQKRADKLESENKKITETARNAKPVLKVQENTARVQSCYQDLNRMHATLSNTLNKLADVTAEKDKYKVKAHKSQLFLWLIILIAGIIVFRKQILRLFSPLKISI